MASTDWVTIQGKKGHGAGMVTDDEKNAIIDRAVSTWEGMGLTDPEKLAFRIATMGLESGFDPHAVGTSPKSDEYGLGQFTKAGWDTAVKYYNKYKAEQEKADWPAVSVEAKEDPDTQILVMGTWIPHIWDSAGEIAGDRTLRGYNRTQITYGKWNKGPGAEADTVRKYLKKNWYDPNIGGYFDPNYNRAMQALKMREEARRTQPRSR